MKLLSLKSLAESREIGETVCAFLNKRGGV